MKPIGFIVILDDDNAIALPYAADLDCPGAIQCYGSGNPPVVFETAADARRAIRISTQKAMLAEASGGILNDDFTTDLKYIKVVPLVAYQKPWKDGAQ